VPAYETIPRLTIPPGDGFVPFRNEEIEQSIPQRFEQQVRAGGERVAIRTDRETFTFEAVNQRANRIARAILSRRGDGAEPIALLFDHGSAVLLSLLAVLKSGKFYVVLDAGYPRDRLECMLQDSGAKLIVTDACNLALAQQLSCGVVDIVSLTDIDPGFADDDLGIYPAPDALALLLYTSGSTGEPKAAMHSHRNVLCDVRNLTNNWCVTEKDRWLLHTSVSFANSVRTIYSSLLNGGSLYLYDIKKSGLAALSQWLLVNEMTIVRTVPTTFREFMASLERGRTFPAVRVLSVGGEPLLSSDLDYFNEHFAPDCVLAHALGPTECLTVCWALIPHGMRIREGKLPIGYPLEDKEVLVLDESHHEVEDGTVGELAVKSRYISLGYWRDPERTTAAFLPDPAGSDARIYLTGDLGVKGRDGCLFHVGREDFQVKIRGFRVDVSEIELALRAIDGVGDAIVVGRPDSSGGQRLVAYFVPSAEPIITVTKLRQSLAGVLPEYMIPSAFVILDAMPKTPNGKTDRLRLPAPTRDRPDMDNEFMPPRTAMEAEIAAVWAEVLDLERVGIHDNFFDLGGNSLLATRILARIVARFKVELPMKALFEAPTVAQTAQTVVLELAKTLGTEELACLLREIEAR
jgi:amino acid adenylation domain-containing protein